MADAIIDIVGQDDLPVIVDLYNQIYRPPKDADSFKRRFRGRYNILQMIARIKDQPVGFFMGFELKPTTFFAWFYGVLPDYRRQGIATQLMEAVHDWARGEEYESIRLECHNAARSMLHLAIALDYIVAGIRWDPDRGDNLVIFEKTLGDD
jgi:GNAT superfamily N-acetyltransferase